MHDAEFTDLLLTHEQTTIELARNNALADTAQRARDAGIPQRIIDLKIRRAKVDFQTWSAKPGGAFMLEQRGIHCWQDQARFVLESRIDRIR